MIIFFTEYLHKKDYNGVLYNGEYNNNIVINFGKCKAINFYERFRNKKGKMIKEKENFLLKSHNEKRFQRGSDVFLFNSDDYLKEILEKKLRSLCIKF